MLKRLIPILLVLLSIVAFPACGGGDEGDVEDTINEFADATKDEDYGKICDLLSDDIKGQIPEGTSCEDALEEEGISDEDKQEAEDVEIEDVEVDGVVWLRGEVKRPEQIKAIETTVRGIPEVQDVENLLHLPKTPAKTRTRAGAKVRAQSPSRITKNVNAEKTTPGAEPTPAEKAATGAGRDAAPFGSRDSDPDDAT